MTPLQSTKLRFPVLRAARRFAACLALGLALLAARAAVADEPIAIIVNADWKDVTAIEMADLQKLYLGKRISVLGKRVECLHLASGSSVREGFLRSVLERSNASLELYWLQQALTGGRIPPREFSSAQEILERVRTRPYQIAYLPLAEVAAQPAGVRILNVLQQGESWHPRQAGYPIRYALPMPMPAK